MTESSEIAVSSDSRWPTNRPAASARPSQATRTGPRPVARNANVCRQTPSATMIPTSGPNARPDRARVVNDSKPKYPTSVATSS